MYENTQHDYKIISSKNKDCIAKMIKNNQNKMVFKSKFLLEFEPDLVYKLIYDI